MGKRALFQPDKVARQRSFRSKNERELMFDPEVYTLIFPIVKLTID